MTEVKIPEGYKQTEVGVIPKGWEVEPLKSLLKEPPKYGINAAAVPLTGNLPVYIRITDISEDGYYSPEKVVGVNSPFSSSYILNEGDIVLARTGASVGKSYLYRKEDGTLIYAGFLIKVSPNEKQLNPKYLHQYLKTEHYWAWVIVNSMRSGQPGINGNEYGRLLIPLPSIEEQTAIATALSDVDNLIGSLEKLIAKKEAIKMGTMQQLLTGKTRLPEFATHDDGSSKGFKQTELGRIPEDWEVKKLNQISDVKSGGTPSTSDSSYWNGSILWCTPTDITALKSQKYLSNTLKKITKAGLKNSSAELLPIGSIVMTSRATIGECAITTKNISTNQGFKNFICFDNTDNEFLYYSLSNSKNRLVHLCSGSTFLEISTTQTRNFEIVVPSTQEQTAIATVLSDMDTEIQALQQRLAKTRDIKQGMMQQLLTGKVRLVTSSTESDTQTLANKDELPV